MKNRNVKTVCKMWTLAAIAAVGMVAAGCAGKAKPREESTVQTENNQRMATVMVQEISGNRLKVIDLSNRMSEEQGSALEIAGEIGGEMDGAGYEIMEKYENDYTGDMSESVEGADRQTLAGALQQAPDMEQEESGSEVQGEESVEIRIPVGTVIHTADGKTTAIAGIKPGDLLQISFETDENGKEVPVEIWMR